MSIERAVTIPGLVSERELDALATFASAHYRIVEIGSYLGRSTRALADNTPGCVLAVDNFEGPQDVLIIWKEKQVIFDRFLANIGDLLNKKVFIWKIDHNAITPEKFREQVNSELKADMVFIDGSHTYQDISRDIAFSQNVLEAGGLLCGHDFQLGAPDVIRAVNEKFGAISVVENTSIWFKKL